MKKKVVARNTGKKDRLLTGKKKLLIQILFFYIPFFYDVKTPHTMLIECILSILKDIFDVKMGSQVN